MAWLPVDLFARRQVPQEDAVPRGRGQDFAVWGVTKTFDVTLAPLQRAYVGAVGDIPKVDGSILARGGRRLAVRRESDAPDCLPVPAPDSAFFAGGRVP